jgi:hypothetical protein
MVRPGELIRGQVQVDVDSDCRCDGLSIQVFWRTHGRGDGDEGKGETIQLFQGLWSAEEESAYAFEFEAPKEPATYHGHLINVDWYVVASADIPWGIDPRSREVKFWLAPGDVDKEEGSRGKDSEHVPPPGVSSKMIFFSYYIFHLGVWAMGLLFVDLLTGGHWIADPLIGSTSVFSESISWQAIACVVLWLIWTGVIWRSCSFVIGASSREEYSSVPGLEMTRRDRIGLMMRRFEVVVGAYLLGIPSAFLLGGLFAIFAGLFGENANDGVGLLVIGGLFLFIGLLGVRYLGKRVLDGLWRHTLNPAILVEPKVVRGGEDLLFRILVQPKKSVGIESAKLEVIGKEIAWYRSGTKMKNVEHVLFEKSMDILDPPVLFRANEVKDFEVRFQMSEEAPCSLDLGSNEVCWGGGVRFVGLNGRESYAEVPFVVLPTSRDPVSTL